MSDRQQTSATWAIRQKCLDCAAGSAHEVRICTLFECPLWPWRMGRRPSTLRQRRPELLDRVAVSEMARKSLESELT